MTPSDDMFGSSTGFNQVRAEENRDFYKILGIPRSAKEKEIKKAFKKMSMKYHPDKNKGDEGAMKKYQDITAAYDALSDAERRRKYDQYGEEGLNKPDRGGGGDPFDFFGDFFGGGGRQRQQEDRTGPNMNIKLKITLEDVYIGKEMEIKYTRNTLCPHCRGTGADDPEDIK